jgi:choline-sulfatase
MTDIATRIGTPTELADQSFGFHRVPLDIPTSADRKSFPLRFRVSLVIAFYMLALVPQCAAQSRSAASSKPNVYLITIDTLRADHVHCYGYNNVQTPALDALAKDGELFIQAFTPSPITQTSHTTILTGLLPVSHGVTDFGTPLAPSHPTIAAILQSRDYHTGAFIGSIVLDSREIARGLDHGFDFYDNFPVDHTHSGSFTEKSRWGRIERRGKDVVQHAELWLNSLDDGSHFVWLHLYDPHDPYEPPPPFSDTYKHNLYDGEIAYADSAVAAFIAYLKKQNWYENSMVIVVGDHGEGLGEHQEDTHGIFLYDSTTHVPLIVKLPRAAVQGFPGKRINAQVRSTDIVPTILDALALSLPERSDGESLLPLIAGKDSADRVAFGETNYPLSFGWAPLRSIRDPETKFIEAPRPEFYDLRSDPDELRSTYEPWNAAVQKLRADLRGKFPAQEQGAKSPAAVTAQTTDELKALGYLGPADVGSSSSVSEPSLLPDPKDKIEEQNLLHRAMLAEESNENPKARAALERLLQLNPNSGPALAQLAQLDLAAQNYKQAAELFLRARQSRPNDADLDAQLGEALAATGDLRASSEALQASLKIDARKYRPRLLLATVFLRLQDQRAAKDQLEAALLLNSSDARLRTAASLLEQRKPSLALKQLELLTQSRGPNP